MPPACQGVRRRFRELTCTAFELNCPPAQDLPRAVSSPRCQIISGRCAATPLALSEGCTAATEDDTMTVSFGRSWLRARGDYGVQIRRRDQNGIFGWAVAAHRCTYRHTLKTNRGATRAVRLPHCRGGGPSVSLESKRAPESVCDNRRVRAPPSDYTDLAGSQTGFKLDVGRWRPMIVLAHGIRSGSGMPSLNHSDQKT